MCTPVCVARKVFAVDLLFFHTHIRIRMNRSILYRFVLLAAKKNKNKIIDRTFFAKIFDDCLRFKLILRARKPLRRSHGRKSIQTNRSIFCIRPEISFPELGKYIIKTMVKIIHIGSGIFRRFRRKTGVEGKSYR